MKQRTLNRKDKLTLEIRDTEQKILIATERFRDETDSDLIEEAIYEILALKARYSYLLKRSRAKQEGYSQGEMTLTDYMREAELMG